MKSVLQPFLPVRRLAFWLSLLLAVPLGGCATATGPAFQPAMAPTNRGLVYVYRPSNIFGSGEEWRITIDGQVAGTLLNGGYFALPLDPGLHVVSLKPLEGFLILVPDIHAADVSIEAGRSQYVRVVQRRTGPYSSEMIFQGVGERDALGEIQSLRLSQ